LQPLPLQLLCVLQGLQQQHQLYSLRRLLLMLLLLLLKHLLPCPYLCPSCFAQDAIASACDGGGVLLPSFFRPEHINREDHL